MQQRVFPKVTSNLIIFDRDLLDYVENSTVFDAKDFRDRIAERSIGAQQSITILSHERLSGHPHGYKQNNNPVSIAQRLHAAFPMAKILVIIRNQYDYMLSLYAFRVCMKGMETRNLKDFLVEEGKKGLIETLCYDNLVQHYITLFSRENVLVVPMEMLSYDEHKFLSTVFSFIGYFPRSPTGIDNRRVNSSTRLTSVIAINRLLNIPTNAVRNFLFAASLDYVFDRFRWKYYSLKRNVVTPFFNMALKNGTKITFPEDLKVKLRPKFAHSNRHLNQLINGDLQSYEYEL